METTQLAYQEVGEGADVVREEEIQEPGITIELVDPCKHRNLKCDICEKTFSSSNYLQYHINYVHSEEKIFTCEHCMKNFKAPTHLKLHIQRLHNKNNQYFCNTCTANFGLQYDLKVHMKTHVKDQQFMCEYCDKTLANKRGLEEHRRTHTYERPHICKAAGCGLRFGQKKTLRVHMR
jgi:KRAB domain-containing zinc finger protein